MTKSITDKNYYIEFQCPICGVEWYKGDLENLDSIGCPGCGRKFDLDYYLYEEEPLLDDWREKCYDRMKQDYEHVGQI